MANTNTTIQDWIADQYDTKEHLDTNQPANQYTDGALAVVANKQVYFNTGSSWVLLKVTDQDLTGITVHQEETFVADIPTEAANPNVEWGVSAGSDSLFTIVDKNTLEVKASGEFDLFVEAVFTTNHLVSSATYLFINEDYTSPTRNFSTASGFTDDNLNVTTTQTNRMVFNSLSLVKGDKIKGALYFYGTSTDNYSSPKRKFIWKRRDII